MREQSFEDRDRERGKFIPFFPDYLLDEVIAWYIALALLVVLASLLPAGLEEEADPLNTPAHIKPEWYFLFMFKTLKHVPELAGVLFFTVLGASLFVLPFLDRKAQRERRSPGFTIVFVLVLIYAGVFEVLAIAAPGVAHPPETLTAETYSLSRGIVSLILLWAVLGFIIFYLWQLLRENARVRRLYRGGRQDDSAGSPVG